jgi:hypothetical protein
MLINIQNCSNVTVNGTHNHKNCKPVYCIDTGEMYASALDAAKANGVAQGPMSNCLTGRSKTCNGKRFCYISKMAEHLEEINEANRAIRAKVAAYDADEKRRNALAAAEADVQKWETRVEELKEELAHAESNLNLAKYDLMELKNCG